MPPRRDSRSHSAPQPAWESARGSEPHRRRATTPRLLTLGVGLGILLRLGTAALGCFATLALLGWVWPRRDPSLEPRQQLTAADLAETPSRAVTVLVIGSDADRLGAASNGAAPAGAANGDALLLVRVNPEGPLQVLNLPTDLAVNLPGESRPVKLGSLYRRGGVALTADAVRELVGLKPPAPDRYLVLPRASLRKLVDDVGGLELDPPRTMRYEDKTQKYKIDLGSGLQRLDGKQVEQMVRWRSRDLGPSARRINHELVEKALRDQLAQPEQLQRLPSLLTGLEGRVDTNLSLEESLSLLAAGLDRERPLQFASLPLAPAKKEHGELRQLDPKANPPLWTAP